MEINLVTRSGGNNLRMGNNLRSLKILTAITQNLRDLLNNSNIYCSHTSFDRAVSADFLKIIHPCFRSSDSIGEDKAQIDQFLSSIIKTNPTSKTKPKASHYDFGSCNFTIFHDLANVGWQEFIDNIYILAKKEYHSITIIVSDLFAMNCIGHEEKFPSFEELIELPSCLIEKHRLLQDFTNGSPLVGIHMRKTDYRSWCNGKHFFEDDYYLKIANYVQCKFTENSCKLLFISDEPIENAEIQKLSCHQNVVVLFNKEEFHPDSLDLVLLSLCDLILGPISTYNAFADDYRQLIASKTGMPGFFTTSRIILSGNYDEDKRNIDNLELNISLP